MWVNIVIPMKNAAPFIGAAVASALDQACVKRVIVVDDASTDGSAEIIAHIKDERVTLIRGDGRGVSAARNLGYAEIERLSDTREAACSWVMFLDADDRLVPGATQKLLEGVRGDCVAELSEAQFGDLSVGLALDFLDFVFVLLPQIAGLGVNGLGQNDPNPRSRP